MPPKRKEQSKRTPERGARSSIVLSIRDLRSISEKRFAEIGSKVRWVAKQTDELPASESGPLLNDAIIAALEEVRRLLPEFVQRLSAIGLNKKQVRREAVRAFSSFRKISTPYISDNTWEELQRNALAEGAHASLHREPLKNSAQDALGKASITQGFRHADDFSWVEVGGGKRKLLTPRQATVIKTLAQAGPSFELTQAAVRAKLDPPRGRIRDTFKRSGLWGTLIGSNPLARTVRLLIPPATT